MSSNATFLRTGGPAADVAAPADVLLDCERLDVYRVTLEFQELLPRLLPRRGYAALRDQLERASASALLNIAEGCGRSAPGDKAQFYAIARGSTMESAAVLDLLQARGLLVPALHRHARSLLVRVTQMLTRLIQRMHRFWHTPTSPAWALCAAEYHRGRGRHRGLGCALAGPSMAALRRPGLIAHWARYLFFLANREELAALSWRRFLGPALVATWLAGMGRYWDHPSAHLLQMFGVGSVVYVFVLGALLWVVIAPLRPRGWGYLQTVTFVSLTAPPALLYAIPVERWMTLDHAIVTNACFLALVAAWRVALLVFTLRRHAQLTWPRTLLGSLLPLCAIVVALFALNLEKAVFEIMGGFRERTPNDGALTVLFLLTLLSFYAALPLLVLYLMLVRRARSERAEGGRGVASLAPSDDS